MCVWLNLQPCVPNLREGYGEKSTAGESHAAAVSAPAEPAARPDKPAAPMSAVEARRARLSTRTSGAQQQPQAYGRRTPAPAPAPAPAGGIAMEAAYRPPDGEVSASAAGSAAVGEFSDVFNRWLSDVCERSDRRLAQQRRAPHAASPTF